MITDEASDEYFTLQVDDQDGLAAYSLLKA
jgi:hypothetical protein